MAISSEIEKLEKRWQATSGLVFAPLAEAYRKAGLQARALEILEQGLALHAEYGPALIVRARCHLDIGDFRRRRRSLQPGPRPRSRLDPIALRGLADVCERTGTYCPKRSSDCARSSMSIPGTVKRASCSTGCSRRPAEVPEVIAAAPAPEPVPEYLEPAATSWIHSTSMS